MSTKAEIEQQLDDLGTAIGEGFTAIGQAQSDGFTALGQTITTETQQVLDAIAAGQDLTSVANKITALRGALTTSVDTFKTNLTASVDAAKAQVDAIVTPPTP